MAYTDDATLSQDPVFQSRVRMSMVKAAWQISTEARTIRNIVDQKRNALARSILVNPQQYVPAFTAAAIEAGGLTAAVVDSGIDGAVQNLFNMMAGVTEQDLA